MVTQNKILTVSYGTFSCTLEGFDNPFNTMKAIAEYFRDLAADDRYFGAEPPQPDAGMLKQIAEREMHRRIEAKISDNSVILRASEPMGPDMVPPDPGSAPADDEATPPARVIMPAATEAPALPDPHATPALAAASAETVAAKLARIRAAVAKARPEADVEQPLTMPEQDDSDWLEDTQLSSAGNDDIGLQALVAAVAQRPATEVADLPDAPVDASLQDGEADFDDLASTEASLDSEAAVEDAENVTPDAAFAAPQTENRASPDQPALDDGFDDELDLDSLGARLVEPSAPGIDAPAPPEAAAVQHTPDTDQPDTAPHRTAPDAEASEAPRRQRVIRIRRASVAPVAASAGLLSPEAEAELARELALATADLDLPVSGDTPSVQQEQSAEADVMRAIMDTLAAEAEDIAPASPLPVDAELEAALDPEPEAAPAFAPEDDAEEEIAAETPNAQAETDDLSAALAGLSDQFAPPPATEARPARPVRPSRPAGLERARAERPAPVVPSRSPRRAALERGPDDAAEADRLLRQTNDALEGPESRRRVANISHLKAAVAATVAERLSRTEGDATDSDPSEAFRADLAQAVRPRRPTAVPAAAVVPSRPGSATRNPVPPLVLVSEQRVPKARTIAEDLDDDEDGEDHDAPNIFAASGDFSDFGLQVGAKTAAEWMEAAAAHLILKDGFETFTRPQLMGRMLSHPPLAAKLDREGQLAQFGALLREGRLIKPKRGQFTLPEDAPLLAQAKRLAG